MGGLVASIVAGVFLIDAPTEDLPGVALGSAAILVVERIIALVAAWLLVLIVVDRAIAGQLPSEVSGRGVRYADADSTRAAVLDVQTALGRLDGEVADLRSEVFAERDGGAQCLT